jgi:hypothetical protein
VVGRAYRIWQRQLIAAIRPASVHIAMFWIASDVDMRDATPAQIGGSARLADIER